MDQFNKILAAFLLLIVAVGLAIFVFSRLGLLGKIFPQAKTGNTQVANTISATPTPSISPDLSPSITPTQTGLLGWISKLRGGATTPTATPPKQTPTPTQMTQPPLPTQEAESTVLSTETTQPTAPPAVTIIPYGSASPTSYPASGAETFLIPLAGLGIILGRYLRGRAKTQ